MYDWFLNVANSLVSHMLEDSQHQHHFTVINLIYPTLSLTPGHYCIPKVCDKVRFFTCYFVILLVKLFKSHPCQKWSRWSPQPYESKPKCTSSFIINIVKGFGFCVYYHCVLGAGGVYLGWHLTFLITTKNEGKLPVTMSKPSNCCLPTGKKSVYWLRFLMVKSNFQWLHLDAPVTLGSKFKNCQKNYCPGNNHSTMFNSVNYSKIMVNAKLGVKSC